MSHELVALMQELRSDPTAAVRLYRVLYEARYWVPIRDGAPLSAVSVLAHRNRDKRLEIPVFTSPDCALLGRLVAAFPGHSSTPLDGGPMWRMLLDRLENGDVVDVDPGENHVVRLTRTMVLGMVMQYGDESTRDELLKQDARVPRPD